MEPGDVIAERFVLGELLGRGGMGSVYQASDRVTGDVVALKVLREDSSATAARFSRESQVLAELHHPGIVRYVAHGVTRGGVFYLAMEWLDGEDLASRLARDPLTIGGSIAMVSRVAAALAAV